MVQLHNVGSVDEVRAVDSREGRRKLSIPLGKAAIVEDPASVRQDKLGVVVCSVAAFNPVDGDAVDFSHADNRELLRRVGQAIGHGR